MSIDTPAPSALPSVPERSVLDPKDPDGPDLHDFPAVSVRCLNCDWSGNYGRDINDHHEVCPAPDCRSVHRLEYSIDTNAVATARVLAELPLDFKRYKLHAEDGKLRLEPIPALQSATSGAASGEVCEMACTWETQDRIMRSADGQVPYRIHTLTGLAHWELSPCACRKPIEPFLKVPGERRPRCHEFLKPVDLPEARDAPRNATVPDEDLEAASSADSTDVIVSDDEMVGTDQGQDESPASTQSVQRGAHG